MDIMDMEVEVAMLAMSVVVDMLDMSIALVVAEARTSIRTG